MMSFTSEMHLPQHCQIGLIHTGKAGCVSVCVCPCVCAHACVWIWICFWEDSVGVQHLYPVIYQDGSCLHMCVFVCSWWCVCVSVGTVVRLPCVDRNVKLPCFGEMQKSFVQSESKPAAAQHHFPFPDGQKRSHTHILDTHTHTHTHTHTQHLLMSMSVQEENKMI